MNRRQFQQALASMLATCGVAPLASAAGKPRKPRSLPNWRMTTTGGQQLWGDVRYHGGYRIQQHALTGHFRLLDPHQTREAWGTLPACEAALQDICSEQNVPPMAETAVIFLHGLFRTRWSMNRIARTVCAADGWEPIVLGYPSTRGTISEHAEMLDQVVAHLDGVRKVHFVAHSLGNLVVRHWLRDAAEQTLKAQQMQLGRIVMLGPPNHRPALAKALVPIDRHHIIAGDAGKQLNGDWSTLADKLATPPCDFGILAGGTGNDSGHNPLIPGDDDMIVGVQETHLAGARDFRVLPVIHATMMDVPEVHQMTLTFLQHGYFESAESQRPLEQRDGG